MSERVAQPSAVGTRPITRSVAAIGIAGALVGLSAAALGGLLAGLEGTLAPRFPLAGLAPYFPLIVASGLCVAVAAATLVSGAAFRNRFRVVSAMLILGPMTVGIGAGPLDFNDPIFLTGCFLWLASLLVERRPVRTPTIALILMVAISCFTFMSIVNGQVKSLISQHTLLKQFVLVMIMSAFIDSPGMLRLAIRVFIIGTGVSALVACASQIVWVQFGYPFVFHDELVDYFKDTPLGQMLRVTALQVTAHGLAHLCTVGLAMLLMVRTSVWWRIVFAPIMIIAVGNTFTAGGYVVLVVVCALVPIFWRPKLVFHIVAAYAVIAGLTYFSGLFDLLNDNVLRAIGGGGASERAEFFRAGTAAFAQHPWLGVGLKNIRSVYDEPIHNAYFQMTVDIGAVGGLIFTGFIAYLTVSAGVLAAVVREPEIRSSAKGALLGMIALATVFLVEPLYDNVVSWMFMGLVASVVGVGFSQHRRERWPGGPPPDSSNGLRAMDDYTIGDYWTAIYRRRFIILLLVAVSAGSAFVISKRVTPLYESRAIFYIPEDVTKTASSATVIESARMPSGSRDFARAYSSVLKTTDTAQIIAERVNAYMAELGLTEADGQVRTKDYNRLNTDVDITIERDGHIHVFSRDRDPRVAAYAANELVAYFTEFHREMIGREIDQSFENFREAIALVDARLAELNAQRRDFREDNRIAALAAELDQLELQRTRATEDLDDAEIEVIELTQEIAALTGTLASETEALDAGEYLLQSPVVDTLKQRITQIEIDLAGRRVELAAEHPEIKALEREYERATGLLTRELDRIAASRSRAAGTLAEELARRVATAEVDLAGAEARAGRLLDVRQRIDRRVEEIPSLLARSETIDDQIATLRTERAALFDAAGEMAANRARFRSPAVVTQQALPRETPSFPVLPLNVPIAAVFGAVAGLVYALIVEYVQSSARLRRERRAAQLLQALGDG